MYTYFEADSGVLLLLTTYQEPGEQPLMVDGSHSLQVLNTPTCKARTLAYINPAASQKKILLSVLKVRKPKVIKVLCLMQ